MKTKWISVNEQPVPLEKRLLVTDGRTLQLCTFHHIDITGRIEYIQTRVDGATGYEWEEMIPFELVTHWIDMSGMELPK